MIRTRRNTFETIREGPALFAGLPGDEVDVDRLVAHLAARRFDGGVCVSDRAGDGVLWIRDGEADEAWFFDASGHEAVLPGVYGHDLLRDIAARGGLIGVVVGAPEFGPPAITAPEPPEVSQVFDAGPAAVVPPQWVGEPSKPAATPVPPPEPATGAPPRPAPAAAAPQIPPPAVHAPVLQPEPLIPTSLPDDEMPVIPEPPSHPWAGVLQEVGTRVVRHRGPRLAALYTSALAKALAEHGGRMERDRIVAPPLSESTWRVIVEAACAPIVSIAGRAFTDRTIAAAERAVRDSHAGGGERR